MHFLKGILRLGLQGRQIGREKKVEKCFPLVEIINHGADVWQKSAATERTGQCRMLRRAPFDFDVDKEVPDSLGAGGCKLRNRVLMFRAKHAFLNYKLMFYQFQKVEVFLAKLDFFFYKVSKEKNCINDMARTKSVPRKIKAKVPRSRAGKRSHTNAGQSRPLSRRKKALPIFTPERPAVGVQTGAPGEACRYLLQIAHEMHVKEGALPSVVSNDRWPVSRMANSEPGKETWVKTLCFWKEANMIAMVKALSNQTLRDAVVPFEAYYKPLTVTFQPGGILKSFEETCFTVKVVMEGGQRMLPKDAMLFHSFLTETIPNFIRAKLNFVDIRKDNAVVKDGQIRLIDFAGTVYEGTSKESERSPLKWITVVDEATEAHHLNFVAIADPTAEPLEQQTNDVYMCLTALEAAHEMLGSKKEPYLVVQHFLQGLEQDSSSAEECLEVTVAAFVSSMEFLLPTF